MMSEDLDSLVEREKFLKESLENLQSKVAEIEKVNHKKRLKLAKIMEHSIFILYAPAGILIVLLLKNTTNDFGILAVSIFTAIALLNIGNFIIYLLIDVPMKPIRDKMDKLRDELNQIENAISG